jgi:hypothetical protein
MAVDEPRQQRRAAKIDDLCIDRSGYLRRRADFLDLVVRYQHGRGRENISGAWIQQSARFDQSHRNCRLGGRLRSRNHGHQP